MRLVGSLSLLMLAACGTRAPKPAAPLVLQPTAAGATAYTEPTAPAADGDLHLRRTLLRTVRDAARAIGRQAPTAHPPLHAVADALAKASDGSPPDPGTLSFAAAHHGIIEPIPIVLVIKGRAPDRDIAERLAASVKGGLARGAYNRVGVGSARHGDDRVVVIALLEARVDLEPIPRALPAGGTALISGTLTGSFSRAELYMTGTDGTVQTLSKTPGRRFSATLRCTGVGVHQVEVMGSSSAGPSVLANFPVWCGEAPPTTRTVRRVKAVQLGERDAERALLESINQERARQALPPVRWHEKAAQVARGHARDMRTNGFVGHISKKTGSPGDRARKAGLVAGAVLENVGVGPDLPAVHEGLMQSPSHRAAILHPTVSHVGVGVARRPRAGAADYFATELFLTPPPPVDAAKSRALVEAAVARRARGRNKDAGLEAVAQTIARDLAKGRLKSRDANAETTRRVRRSKVKISALMALMGVGTNPESLAKDKALHRRDYPRFGVGIAAGKKAGRPVLYTVILLAR